MQEVIALPYPVLVSYIWSPEYYQEVDNLEGIQVSEQDGEEA